MRLLIVQLSGLVGTLTFLSQATADVALLGSALRGLATAAVVLLIMLLGDLLVHAVTRAPRASTNAHLPRAQGQSKNPETRDAVAA